MKAEFQKPNKTDKIGEERSQVYLVFREEPLAL